MKSKTIIEITSYLRVFAKPTTEENILIFLAWKNCSTLILLFLKEYLN